MTRRTGRARCGVRRDPFLRGANSVTLFHDGERWWIMGWMFDTSAGTEGQ